MRCLLVSLVFLASLGSVSPVFAAPCVMSAGEAEVLQRVNALRASMKRPPLRCHPTLLQYARQWSQKMCDHRFFSHNDPAGKDNFSPRMARISMQIAQTGLESFGSAENIFAGSPYPREAIQSWMQSPGHRRNILSPTSTHLGTGYIFCRGRHLWTQIFMRLQKAAPTRHFGTRIPPSALSIEDDKSLLLLKVGTQQRRTTRQVTRTLQDGVPTTTTTTTTTITTVYPGPRAGSRKIQTTVITNIEIQTPRSSRSRRKESTRTRVVYDF
jgi:hypothetical protein